MKVPNERVQIFSKPRWLKGLTSARKQKFVVTFFLFCSHTVFATPLFFQNSNGLSSKNIDNGMKWFSSAPHPMSTNPQKKIQEELVQTLQRFGLKTQTQRFLVQAPNLKAAKWGGKDMTAPITQKREGVNVFATRPGNGHCSLILSGHYDTKYFPDFRFVGANDGGSSTALLLELARVVRMKRFPAYSLGNCDITFAFFDGEESFLPEWSEAEKTIQMRDNTYGSRIFAKNGLSKKGNSFLFQGQPLQLMVVFDMVGHKNQKLFLTNGSHPFFSKKFLASAVPRIDAQLSSYFIEDDHIPFLQLGIPVLHVIDWHNLQEWHTSKDTRAIISSEKIKKLAEAVLNFLTTTGLP